MVIMHYFQKYIDKIKLKSYNHGQHDVISELKSTAFWFNAPEHRKEFNALMLYSIIYKEYGSVDSDLFRKKIINLGDKKLQDLSADEIKKMYLF